MHKERVQRRTPLTQAIPNERQLLDAATMKDRHLAGEGGKEGEVINRKVGL